MKSMIIVALLTLLIAFYQNYGDINDNYNNSLRTNKASMFINYTTSFDAYYLVNSSSDGDVTSKVTLPTWIPTDSSIKMYISGGYGYVYMPMNNGILSEIMKATDYSALVGVSDSTGIKTISGTIPKPAFIPSGYVVYVR